MMLVDYVVLGYLFCSNMTHFPVSTDDEHKPIFGVPLAVAVARSKCHDGVPLPAIFRECIDYIEEFGECALMIQFYKFDIHKSCCGIVVDVFKAVAMNCEFVTCTWAPCYILEYGTYGGVMCWGIHCKTVMLSLWQD